MAKRSVAIVGAGQAGLQLALGLLSKNYEVTIVAERNPEEILAGKILSSQGMFNEALQFERELGIDFWRDSAPQNTSLTFTIANPESIEIGIRWKGLVNKPFQSVDQRLKFSHWLNEIEKRGGRLIIQAASVKMLDELSTSHDLTVVSSGKGALSKIFQRDTQKSIHCKPARVLSCIYVKGMLPIAKHPGVCVNIIPGVGEYFVMPGLTLNDPCEMMLFEGIPEGAFDCWKNIHSSEQQLKKAITLLNQFIPWEAERCINLELSDEKATLMGGYTPEIRHPVYKLPSGQSILGMADAVVLNDPVAGQGANNASKCAKVYLESILLNQDRPFSDAWMQSTFNRYWEDAQWSTALSNLLLMPPEPHVMELLSAAAQLPALADKIANGFDHPGNLFPWINNPSETRSVIKRFEHEHLSFVSQVEAIGV